MKSAPAEAARDPRPKIDVASPCPPPTNPKVNGDVFGQIASWTTRATGGRWGFIFAISVVLIWAMLGPYFHFSDVWQLVINTGTTIITFLMVFLIQNAQNRESKAVHLKLDELIFAVKTARNEMIDVERLSEEQLDLLGQRYRKVAERHQPVLESMLEAVGEQFEGVEEEIGKVEQHVENLEQKMDKMDQK